MITFYRYFDIPVTNIIFFKSLNFNIIVKLIVTIVFDNYSPFKKRCFLLVFILTTVYFFYCIFSVQISLTYISYNIMISCADRRLRILFNNICISGTETIFHIGGANVQRIQHKYVHICMWHTKFLGGGL